MEAIGATVRDVENGSVLIWMQLNHAPVANCAQSPKKSHWPEKLGIEHQLQLSRLVVAPLWLQKLVVEYDFQIAWDFGLEVQRAEDLEIAWHAAEQIATGRLRVLPVSDRAVKAPRTTTPRAVGVGDQGRFVICT
jgi:hypothetical protein